MSVSHQFFFLCFWTLFGPNQTKVLTLECFLSIFWVFCCPGTNQFMFKYLSIYLIIYFVDGNRVLWQLVGSHHGRNVLGQY